VLIRAPLRASGREIAAFAERNKQWIEEHLAKARERDAARASVPKLTQEEIRRLAEQALRVIPERAARYAPLIGVRYGRITIRCQKTRWGSCSSKGNLNFNCLLMLAPEAVRDYVVVHELCHRKQMNHSEAFWAEVERVLPEYRQARKWLKMHGQELMQYNTEN
jgi:predicted metal-dependent hydrolase